MTTSNQKNALRALLDSGDWAPDEVIAKLAVCWDEFLGSSDSGMGAYKLDRAEDLHWDPPRLTFTIERHGATVKGSSRAETQRWVVDFDAGTAEGIGRGFRQVRPLSPRLDVQPIAAEIAELIVSGRDDPRLQWMPDRTKVRVLTGKIIPDSGPKQTVQGRRARFTDALIPLINESGWQQAGGGWYTQQGR